MRTEKYELKPCPFCAEQPRIIKSIDGDCQIFCVCEHEPMIIMKDDKFKEAIKAWNTRK